MEMSRKVSLLMAAAKQWTCQGDSMAGEPGLAEHDIIYALCRDNSRLEYNSLKSQYCPLRDRNIDLQRNRLHYFSCLQNDLMSGIATLWVAVIRYWR